MKIVTFRNLMLLTSVTLFTACSTTSPKPDKLTTLEIIGINTGKSIKKVEAIILTVNITENSILPMAKTYPLNDNFSYESYKNIQSQRFNNSIPNNLTIVNDVENKAKKLLGIKYVWGATGPYKYDCSGFTQKIYRDAGINIPRVSRDQARVGQFIAYNNLRRGDMVFFDTKKKRSGKVSHVGIYLGAGNFIHASSAAKKIVIYNFNDKSFYKKRFLWGRRVIRNSYHMASL
jgi:cell wall-associated NlpC family hydrolase